MRQTSKLVLLAASAVSLIPLNRALASDQAQLPPRTAEVFSVLRTVPGSSEDRIDRSVKSIPPRTAEVYASLRTVTGSSDVDLAHPTGTVAMGKQSIFLRQFEVAPVK